MSRPRSSSSRQWNVYTPPETSSDGMRGQASFFYYNPEGSSQSQWWYNTFAEGQEQPPPPVEYHDPYAGNIGYYPGLNYTPENADPDDKYLEYQPQQRLASPPPRPRSGTVTPPPPQLPSADYLAISEGPSQQLSDPSSCRKLLILDLNGTLLHRSPHTPRNKGRILSQPRLRSVHPRPYMSSFRSYVFHPKTKVWLDVMIWSSAQPHSVADMVDKCFGEQQDRLVAVWARDTLGLPEQHYYRKVQTTKDLNAPWNRLFAPRPRSEGDAVVQRSTDPPKPFHSAMTTLLMDDSPRKAELQPYNHLCIKEYAAELRTKDLLMLQVEKQRVMIDGLTPVPTQVPPIAVSPTLVPLISTPIPPPAEETVLFQPDGTMGIQPDATLLQSTSTMPLQDDIPGLIFSDPLKEQEQRQVLLQEEQTSLVGPKKRKRKKKKAQSEGGAGTPEVKYDETLLAIVGILDEMKLQSNVSGWVKAGGLWGPATPSNPTPRAETSVIKPICSTETEGSDLSAEDGQGEEKRQRREAVAVIEVQLQPTGNDAVVAPVEEPAGKATGLAMMWFDNPLTVDYWIGRGRKALKSLGIPIDHGLDR